MNITAPRKRLLDRGAAALALGLLLVAAMALGAASTEPGAAYGQVLPSLTATVATSAATVTPTATASLTPPVRTPAARAPTPVSA